MPFKQAETKLIHRSLCDKHHSTRIQISDGSGRGNSLVRQPQPGHHIFRHIIVLRLAMVIDGGGRKRKFEIRGWRVGRSKPVNISFNPQTYLNNDNR